MYDLSDFIRTVANHLHALLASPAFATKCLTLAGLFVCAAAILSLNWKRGRKIPRPAWGSFRTDVVYTLLLLGGAYGLFREPLLTFVDSFLRWGVPFIYLELLRALPGALQFIVFLIAVDFCRYWKHRWLHSKALLRGMHSIHHSAENLNFFTAYRIHLLEYLFDALITFLPVALLGSPPELGLAVYIALISYNGFLHSGMNVSFGPLDCIFVSPRFHATHHSADRAEYDANFGSLFSIWDIAFGTAKFQQSLPEQYGLPNAKIPSSFSKQLLFPLMGAIRRRRPIQSRAQVINPMADGMSFDSKIDAVG